MSDVPLSVLVAITQLETGRSRNGQAEPWPWTINLEGQGHWFDSQDAALTFARQALTAGRTSFDTGCFQINYRWHSGEFVSLDAMFDPVENAHYAARFLTQLYTESGDWSIAAGAYHSRTESHASRYRQKFDALRLAASGTGDDVLLAGAVLSPVENSPPAGRENTFPLLRPSSGGLPLGSLVPLSGGG